VRVATSCFDAVTYWDSVSFALRRAGHEVKSAVVRRTSAVPIRRGARGYPVALRQRQTSRRIIVSTTNAHDSIFQIVYLFIAPEKDA
jgi:hypothetical protein